MKPFRPTFFSESRFFSKIGKVFKTAGIVVVYPALSLYYLLLDKEVPTSSKTIIIAALSYFIFPLDSIPDMTPIIGYSDDLGILYVSLSQLAKYLSPEILAKVREKIMEWFGDEKIVAQAEEKLLLQINKKNNEH